MKYKSADKISMPSIAIVKFKCLVGGRADGGYDYKVMWFDADDRSTALATINSLTFESYHNEDGELVEWVFDVILDHAPLGKPNNGDELVGFVGGDCDSRDDSSSNTTS